MSFVIAGPLHTVELIPNFFGNHGELNPRRLHDCRDRYTHDHCVHRIRREYNVTEPVLTGSPRAQYPETYTQTHERECMVYCLSSLGNFFAPGWDRTRAAGLRGRRDNHYTTPTMAAAAAAVSAEIGLYCMGCIRVAHEIPVYAQTQCIHGRETYASLAEPVLQTVFNWF